MKKALGKGGYQVTGYTDPKAALVEFTTRAGAYDVVITDLAMPTLPGIELAEEMRKVRNDIPIILTSGYIRAEDRERAEELRINSVVYKSNTVDQLANALADAISSTAIRRGDDQA